MGFYPMGDQSNFLGADPAEFQEGTQDTRNQNIESTVIQEESPETPRIDDADASMNSESNRPTEIDESNNWDDRGLLEKASDVLQGAASTITSTLTAAGEKIGLVKPTHSE